MIPPLGKSPIIVFDDADVDAVVDWASVGIFFNAGQVCSATSRLLIQEGIKVPCPFFLLF